METEAINFGLNLAAPLEQVATGFIRLLETDRKTMSQDNRDRADDIGIRFLEQTLGKLLPPAADRRVQPLAHIQAESVDVGISLGVPLEQLATAFLNLLATVRETMSQANIDRVDAIRIRLLDATIGRLVPATAR